MDTTAAVPSVVVEPRPRWLDDPDALSLLVDKLRAAGVRSFEHPCGLKLVFEPAPKPAGNW